MDRSYMLNDYVAEQENDLNNKLEATQNLDKLEFRIKGSKTVNEIKREVFIFLERNDVPVEISEGLQKICNEFSENTDVYHASLYLENFMNDYLKEKEKDFLKSSDTVQEIKEELIEDIKKDLDSVGIALSGSQDVLIDSIQSEDDVYKLKNNVERTTEYFQDRNEIISSPDKTLVELSSDEVAEVLERPNDEALLKSALEQQERQNDISNNNSQVELKDDGSIVVHGDIENTESMNFAAMMTIDLVSSTNDFEANQKLDMKFIKYPEQESAFKIIYGNFPLINQPNNNVDPMIVSRVNELVNSYQSNISYIKLLGTKSPELMLAMILLQEQILNEKGAFQMAVKNDGNHYGIMIAADENYAHVINAFSESGAMVTYNAMEHGIIRVNDTTPGEQLMVLNATLENLRQKKEASLVNQNSYQKQLLYPNNMNEAANVHTTFLIVVLVTEVLLLCVSLYFILM